LPNLSEPLYPVTIITTRYSGVYEGGTWAAFPLDPDQALAFATRPE
jgi:hypothetical protein